MSAAISIEQLDVIGCADPPTAAVRPSIVPPVFAFRDRPETGLVPPYSLSAGFVCGATEINRAELSYLQDAGDILLFEKPFRALTDFELWIDESGVPHYGPRADVQEELHSLAMGLLRRAAEDFRKGRFEDADRLCSAAISADDRYLEAFALKAAIRRWQQDDHGEKLMAQMVSRFLDSQSFTEMVTRWSKESQRPRSTPNRNCTVAPMRSMACAR
jgi:hypothetical protein